MEQRQKSVDETLKAIRELMSSNNRADEGILELTEDDLFDEQDEDAHFDHHFPKKEKNLQVINEILTQISHPNCEQEFKDNYSGDDTVSAENAAKSIETIKNLIKKVEQPMPQSGKTINLEEVTMEILQSLLKDWINKNLSSIVQEIVEKEVKRLIINRDEK